MTRAMEVAPSCVSRTVVLAAGAGRRLGGVAKALLRDQNGESFLSLIAARAQAAAAPIAVVVVAEPHREATEQEARRLGLDTVLNPRPEQGMASSVAVGFGASQGWSWDAALLWPVDHAAVTLASVQMVVDAGDADSIVVPTFHGRGGHPTSFGRVAWRDLARCHTAESGARWVLSRHAACVIRLPVSDPGVRVDVDLPADRGKL